MSYLLTLWGRPVFNLFLCVKSVRCPRYSNSQGLAILVSLEVCVLIFRLQTCVKIQQEFQALLDQLENKNSKTVTLQMTSGLKYDDWFHKLYKQLISWAHSNSWCFLNYSHVEFDKYFLKLCMVWRNRKKLQKLAGTTMWKKSLSSVGSEKSWFGPEDKQSIGLLFEMSRLKSTFLRANTHTKVSSYNLIFSSFFSAAFMI